MNIRPLGDRVVIKVLESEQKTASGIVIPDKAKERPQEGEVIAVGSGKILDNGTKVELEVKVGDRVIFSKYAGTEVKIDNEEHLILSERDILAVINK
ncbi:chaperonin GroES [Anaerobranca californiensis DSM 14826]|jgi:chaperonin GroES|uniref:Co-chaperonin GroES n=1 Tax=Anaerobranca californiensis DSM 14826 TaxID=1120989 RepID=A0A1M6QBB9_9FIRM|nr:co-chaperone GroES [Anaerobranca californiensis]SHK17430.1 chaperonin GroES [Anaerobranca californiensis DSM 14826]